MTQTRNPKIVTPDGTSLNLRDLTDGKVLKRVGSDVESAQVDLTTDVTGALPIANGGTGQTTRQDAIDALTDVAAATNEHVLTKDTATGKAVFKAASGGGGGGSDGFAYYIGARG